MARSAMFLVFLLFVSPLFAFDSSGNDKTLTFGVVPQQAASKLARLWGPLLHYVGNKTGYKLLFKTAPNIPEFERRCAAGEYDIAYMNPYHYTVFHRSPGYEAFARQKNKRIRGILVVHKDSSVQTLADLKEQTLAFPAPAAFAASVLVRAKLKKEEIPFQAKYVSSHDSVYRAVAKKIYAAGGGIQRTFNNVAPKVREQLRVLWVTDPFTPHAIAAHPDVSAEIVKRVQSVLIAMENDPQGKVLLSRINFAGIEAAKNEDWDDVRGLGIELLERLIKG